MAPEPPANIVVLPDKNPNRLEVRFDEPLMKPDRYKITAFDDANNVEYLGQHIPPHCYFKELSFGKEYKLCIQSDNGEGLVSKKVSSFFSTYPPKVDGLHLSRCTNERATVNWTRPACIDEFLIRCKCGTKVLSLQSTHRNEFEIIGLKRERVYDVEVAAKNSTGQGEFSDILEFKTALSNLTHVTVSQNELEPTTSLIVEFKGPNKQSKVYIISAKAESDGNTVTKKAQKMRAEIQGLRPGETYHVFIHAKLGNKVSNTARAPEPIQTVPDKVTNVTAESNGDRNILHWPELRFLCSYRVRWKGPTEGRCVEVEAKIRHGVYEWPLDLKPGVKYEVQVCAENRAGSGEWSDPITFTADGERSESGDQGNTTMIDSKFDTYINNTCNVHEDGSTNTKMEKVNVLNVSFPETSLYVELTSKKSTNQCLKYVAQSQATGKKLSVVSSKNGVTLDGVDPGDKYTVYVYDGDETNGACIGSSEIQTSRNISNGDGTVTVGNINLDFPEGAIHNQALTEVSPIVENPPNPPDGSIFVAPPMDFRSSQKIFAKLFTCKLTFPYITVHESIEVDIMCFENNEWQKVCSRQLTESKMLEFKCDHFTIYAVISKMPCFLVKNIPLSYQLSSYIYYDKHGNFTGVTCLNYPPISNECNQQLSKNGYVQTPHVIFPHDCKKFGEEATKYALKCCDPDHTIGEWQVPLNHEFVQSGWRNLTDLNNMVPRLANVQQIELSFKRKNGNDEKE